MFEFLFGASEPHTQQHHMFGMLTFKKKHSSRWWVGTTKFETMGREVNLIIDTKAKDPPTHAQERFFSELRQRYKKILPDIARGISEQYADVGKTVSSEKVLDDLTLNMIHVPLIYDGDPLNWDLEFTISADSCFNVTMLDWEVQFVANLQD